MPRKIIYSYWSLNRIRSHFGKKNNYEDDLKFLEYAKLSNYWAQKNGFETILYTDIEGENLLNKISYNNIKIFNEKILNSLPKQVWSLGKLFAISDMNEPFAHIDFDFFIINNNLNFNEYPFYTFHYEPWWDSDNLHIKNYFLNTLKTKNSSIKKNQLKNSSFNCSLFIGNSGFDFFKENFEKLVWFSKKNIDIYDKFLETYKKQSWAFAVLFEQILFTDLCKNSFNLEKVPTILKSSTFADMNKECLNYKLCHMWAGKKHLKNINLEEILNNLSNHKPNYLPDNLYYDFYLEKTRKDLNL